MRNWAINLLINSSKKNARRRERLFKYFSDVQVENAIIRFESTSTPTRVYDIEAQSYSDNGRVYEDFNLEDKVLYEPDDEYEPIDWHT